EDQAARRTQPPKDMSAMDGYAARAADIASVPATLSCIGEAPAGRSFPGTVGPGECVRIFTGGAVPEGADTIVIQEDTGRDGDKVLVRESSKPGTWVRPAGLDFAEGEVLLEAGRVLTARDIGLAAAMNLPWLPVRRKPRVALLATGDEIVNPGEPLGPDDIVSSNSHGLSALVQACGGEPVNLGIARDDADSLRRLAAGARGADILVTSGGASVGDHDLIRSVLGDADLEVDFWRIAMRPGKPLIFGHFGDVPLLGLPGNPVSAMVCSLLFLRPALRRMRGLPDAGAPTLRARLAAGLRANDRRQDYLRARLATGADGAREVTAFEKQDSSMMRLLQRSDCLIVRPPHAPALDAGNWVEVLQFCSEDGGI
ncbi:MAG: gephyrin-like molybdotransferase Glp, partial [Acetobacterales bacterium]